MEMEIDYDSENDKIIEIPIKGGSIFIEFINETIRMSHFKRSYRQTTFYRKISLYDFFQQIGITEADCIKAFQEKV